MKMVGRAAGFFSFIVYTSVFVGEAVASVIGSSKVSFDLAGFSSMGTMSPYVYNQPIPYIDHFSGLPYSGPVWMVSSYAESGGSWYGYYSGTAATGFPRESNSGIDDAVAGAAIDPSVSAIAKADVNGPGSSEAWVFNVYGFTADVTGQVSFAINYDLELMLTTDVVGESAMGWAFAGMQIMSTFPSIATGAVQQHPDHLFEYFVNGNDIFSVDGYNNKTFNKVSDGDDYGVVQLGERLMTTKEVVAGEDYFVVLAGYAGAGRLPPTASEVPEPGVLLLMSMGLMLLGGFGRRAVSL